MTPAPNLTDGRQGGEREIPPEVMERAKVLYWKLQGTSMTWSKHDINILARALMDEREETIKAGYEVSKLFGGKKVSCPKCGEEVYFTYPHVDQRRTLAEMVEGMKKDIQSEYMLRIAHIDEREAAIYWNKAIDAILEKLKGERSKKENGNEET